MIKAIRYLVKNMIKDTNPRVHQLAWFELNLMRFVDLLPDCFERACISPLTTPVFDVNGEELFHRVPFAGPSGDCGYADISTNPAMGEPLLAFTQEAVWDEEEIQEAAFAAAKERFEGELWRAEIRFVAFSYPKLAAQFLIDGKEVLMLELYSWEPVSPSFERCDSKVPPSNFERWSFLDEMPPEKKKEAAARYQDRIAQWTKVLPKEKIEARFEVISKDAWKVVFDEVVFPLRRSRELHFSTRNVDHVPCFELRSQMTSVWCVAASVQMVLDFYRYEYSQVRIAQQLGLGTLSNPNGLPYSRDGDVVTALQQMTSNALTANMNTTPNWNEFVSEINANRPLVSFIPGHSRVVAGYTRPSIIIGLPGFRGLLVYDPWPPNVGVITRWENFDAMTYRRTFTAHVQRI